MLVTLIAGARPNFMKVAPIIHAIQKAETDGKDIHYRLVHTGQHYDKNMSDTFFEELNIPQPDTNLGCGGGTQAEQTAHIMVEFEKELIAHPCDIVLVVGDVTSTMACSIVAKKLNTRVAHVEAGIRSWDQTMPEEINRMVTDSLADYMFTTTDVADRNLMRQGSLTPCTPSPEESGKNTNRMIGEYGYRRTSDVAGYVVLKEHATEHRLNPTLAEEAMWEVLRDEQLEYKFRRQHIIGAYIVDFVCLEKQLIVEIDGEYHREGRQPIDDEIRTLYLEHKGYRILRFTNDEVLGNIESVKSKLHSSLRERQGRALVWRVGNVMIDTLLKNIPRFRKPAIYDELKLEDKRYIVMTMHRPANVDEKTHLKRLMEEILMHVEGEPVVFPIHPRTAKIFYELWESEEAIGRLFPNLHIVEPMGYLEFNYMVQHARAVVTDSGGITEETTVMGVPCITLRDNTERPETCTIGTNELIGTRPEAIAPALHKLYSGEWKKGGIPELWDGHAAERIVDILCKLNK